MKIIFAAMLMTFSALSFAHREWNVSCWSNGPFSMNLVLNKNLKTSKIIILKNGEIFHEVDGGLGCNEISVYQDYETTHTVSQKDINCTGKTDELVASVYETTTNRIIASFVYYSPAGVDFAQLFCNRQN